MKRPQSMEIAKIIEENLYPMADLLVDLHGGDINEMVMPFLFFPAYAEEKVVKKSREAAEKTLLPYRVASSAKNGLYSWAAQCGIPALLLEYGGLGKWSQEGVNFYKNNIYKLLGYLKILKIN